MKKYYVERRRSTETEWIIEVQDLGFVEAENLKEAKKIVEALYGGFKNFRKLSRKHRPDVAGVFCI